MKDDSFQITVNGTHSFQVHPEEAKGLDLVPNGEEGFHLIYEGRSIDVRLLETDYVNYRYVLGINGKKYEVSIGDYYNRLIRDLGLHGAGSQKINSLKAPMPGLVLEVAVQPGDVVSKGDTLLILEAMKMENVIKAPGDGTVKANHVQKGQPVEKGQLLIEFA